MNTTMTATAEHSSTSKLLPTNGEASSSKQPPQPTMSKAEQSRQRRVIQEQQRAAKAAAKAAGVPPPGPNPTQNRPRSGSKAAPNAASKKGEKGAVGKPAKKEKEDFATASVAGDDLTSGSRGLRIFSHFGLPKTVSHVGKGNVHPAIVRLGLQFSDFKISGANARCIATLTAFKTVSPLLIILKIII